jgi:hypothetical protein
VFGGGLICKKSFSAGYFQSGLLRSRVEIALRAGIRDFIGTKITVLDFLENSTLISLPAFGREVFCFIYFNWRYWIEAAFSGVQSRCNVADLMQVSAWNSDVCGGKCRVPFCSERSRKSCV